MWKPEHRLTAERRNLRCGSGCQWKAITADERQAWCARPVRRAQKGSDTFAPT
ncbi:hypothetical protein ACMYR2_3439 [Nitrobacter sp. TKz-YC01]